MKKSLMLIALLGLLAGCVTKTPLVGTDVNPINGARTDVTPMMLTSAGQLREVVYLNAYREIAPKTGTRYLLEVKYVAPAEVGYLEIPPGQTLTILADGQPIKLDGTGTLNTRVGFRKENMDFVSETAQYRASRLDMQKMGFARQIKVQIKGNKGLIERDFNPENFEKIRAFVTQAVL